MNKTAIVLLLSLLAFSSCKRKGSSSKESQEKDHPKEFLYLPTHGKGHEVHHTYYSLSFRDEHHLPEWVAYELTSKNIRRGRTKRHNDFDPDPAVPLSAHPRDYTRSGYDRGHMVPAGDMKINQTAMEETFYMSNICPQAPALNRGIWRELEEDLRDQAMNDKHLYIITGPILNKIEKRIGRNKVSVPSHYYKIVLDYSEPEIKMIGFIFPNKKCEGEPLDYAQRVDAIEAMTELDFFSALPDSLEEKLEGELHKEAWEEIL